MGRGVLTVPYAAASSTSVVIGSPVIPLQLEEKLFADAIAHDVLGMVVLVVGGDSVLVLLVLVLLADTLTLIDKEALLDDKK